jgi:hypothetical protein
MVVLKVVTLGFQGGVVLVFDFPPAAPGLNHLPHGLVIERMGGGKGILIEPLTVRGGRELAPLDREGPSPSRRGTSRA